MKYTFETPVQIGDHVYTVDEFGVEELTVTEDGIPTGVWIPETKTFRELDAVVLPMLGRKIGK